MAGELYFLPPTRSPMVWRGHTQGLATDRRNRRAVAALLESGRFCLS